MTYWNRGGYPYKPKALGLNPRALGTNPRALGTNPRAKVKNKRAWRNWKRHKSRDQA